jgi:hypothetical protein
MDMPRRKKPRTPLTDGHMLAARDLAKDLVIRAYFARRQKEREGIGGRVRSFFSGRRDTAPVVDIFDHVERKVRQSS